MEKEYEVISTNNQGVQSIVRLSDGQVFKIGDIIDGHTVKNVIIISIIEVGDKIIGFRFYSEVPGNPYVLLRDAKISIKKVIITTEDGKDLFIYDIVYAVDSRFGYYFIKIDQYTIFIEETKYFSTEILAKQYIIFNKPCISIMELVLELKSNHPTLNLNAKKRKEIAESLVKLVKSKI